MNTNPPLKIAVTGASGFIGRHVVMVLDRYASKLAYMLMPVVGLALRLKKRITGMK